MKRRELVSTLALVAVVLVSAVAATVPVSGAGAAAAPPDAAGGASDATDGTYNRTLFTAVADAGDGAVVVAGRTGLRNSNATLMRIGPDGETEWKKSFESENATRVVDLAVRPDDSVYFLLAERPVDQSAGPRAGSTELVHATADGDVVWRTSVDGNISYATGVSVVASDDGAAVVHPVYGAGEGEYPEQTGVRLAEYAGGDAFWERTYGVEASVRSLERTGDGYLVVGSAGFGEPWLLRTTESGRPTFNETYPGLAVQQVAGAVPTESGGALLAGSLSPGFGPQSPMAWVANVNDDGHVTWSRVYGAGSETRVRNVFDTGDGLLLVGQSGALSGEEMSTRLLGVGANGALLFDESVETPTYVTAATLTDRGLKTAGVARLSASGYAGTLDTVSIPDADRTADASLAADAAITSNETVYRGQNLAVSGSSADRTYDLVRIPGEYGDFDPHVVRRVTVDGDDGTVVESATLPPGQYVLRTSEGQPVALRDGRITGPATRSEAAFSLDEQDFFDLETNRTFVNVAAGERGVSMRVDSERTDYDVYVSADRYAGGAATATELEAAFGDVDGFVGVETVDGKPVARIEMNGSGWINASVGALDAGMYEVRVAGVDTRDGGAVVTGRVVVGKSLERRLGLELENRTLTAPVGERASTNVTLTNVTNGIAAMSMSANRTGSPAIQLRSDVRINASRASSSAYWSDRESRTQSEAFYGNTANGTVLVGTVGAEADPYSVDANATGTNTMTFRVDWVVDEDGTPYALPDERTITVEVVPGNESQSDRPTRVEGDGS
ncbi:MAG: hypothetical protein ABEJ40_05140 [Haloarculaceae archaeon]